MLKKYSPYILLLAGAILLWYIKKHQRGNNAVRPTVEKIEPVKNENTADKNSSEPIDRTPEKIIYTKHARCRMECRHIDESEVLEILDEGVINYNKIEKSNKGKSYPLEGITHDKQHVRIVFAPKQENLVVVTVIDLDKDWYCNCK